MTAYGLPPEAWSGFDWRGPPPDGGYQAFRDGEIALISEPFSRRQGLTPGDEVTFDLPLTREAMSDYLGLTLETVSRQISALKREGVIRLEGNRHVIVPKMQRLLNETGDDDLV